MRYYIEDENEPKGFIETTEEEYNNLFGNRTIRHYVQSVYCGESTIEDVPTEHREAVQTVLANKEKRWGVYKEVL